MEFIQLNSARAPGDTMGFVATIAFFGPAKAARMVILLPASPDPVFMDA